MTGGLRSGQVAAAAGVNLQTLRYYERRGLVAEPERTLGGHWLYPEQTLDEVADLLSTVTADAQMPACGPRAQVLVVSRCGPGQGGSSAFGGRRRPCSWVAAAPTPATCPKGRTGADRRYHLSSSRHPAP
ncbi:MerR family DNA-binding transcriptional regulator [Micromonospora sp. CPCC 206061]|uniref:MerR family DNA-binding transcriptional regulator n=1 Tax=Micromonospora sp. CPCC 206061 TaxID=3122410 RepID=UPI002FF2237C